MDGRKALLKEVMAADFTLIDLNLYLNTHPYDARVIALFNSCAVKAKQLREMFEAKYGPLCITSPIAKCPWSWIESPWPWENC